MTRDPMPYIPGIVRNWLLEQPEIMELLHGGTINNRPPPDPLRNPHLQVAVVGHVGADPVLRRLLLQVTPWCPDIDATGLTEDPDVTVWNIAATVGEYLHRARNITIDEKHAWTARWLEGPIQLWDDKRGKDRILHYAPVRFEVHLTRRVPQ